VEVRRRIEVAASRAGRDARAVTLIAVSKTVGVEAIREAISAGIHDFGENRVQELVTKAPAFSTPAAPRWHLIGTLQRNKVRKAVACCHGIHSIDSVSLAQHVSDEAVGQDRQIEVFAQVNVSGEITKSGFSLREIEACADQLAPLPGLVWRGLMTIAPEHADAGDLRSVFGTLRQLHSRLGQCFQPTTWNALSMGMSDDFEIAVEEGATHVRVGRAIFGERPRQAKHRRDESS